MAKPTPEETTSTPSAATATPVQAVPGNAESMVIRAVPGQPWPEPPSGGTWVRNAKTGDLTCIDAGTQPATEEERRRRREQQREAAIKAANTNTAKE